MSHFDKFEWRLLLHRLSVKSWNIQNMTVDIHIVTAFIVVLFSCIFVNSIEAVYIFPRFLY